MNKKVLLISIFSILLSSSAFASEFCDGYDRGYKSGYKQASGSGYDPYSPYCPYQPYKKYSDPDSDYEHGYIIGYEDGRKKG